MNLEEYILSENTTIIEAMEQIEKNTSGIVFLCEKGRLLASVSDGDIRRNMIKLVDINNSIKSIANYNPYFLEEVDKCKANQMMEELSVSVLPIVDKEKKVIDIRFLQKHISIQKKKINIPVVIMAGGKGERLKPYTDIIPKPLIPISSKTIIEHIMQNFKVYGCDKFNLIINYKKNLIKAYFMDSDIEGQIDFTEEEDFLGTAGGLSLINGKIKETFFLTNCDILIDANYSDIYDYHKRNKNLITIVCAKKEFVIPYGTVNLNESGKTISIKEKPIFEFNVNTGFYVVEPELLEKIPTNVFIHITDVIEQCIKDNKNIGTFLINEGDWKDMGQFQELENMKNKLLF